MPTLYQGVNSSVLAHPLFFLDAGSPVYGLCRNCMSHVTEFDFRFRCLETETATSTFTLTFISGSTPPRPRSCFIKGVHIPNKCRSRTGHQDAFLHRAPVSRCAAAVLHQNSAHRLEQNRLHCPVAAGTEAPRRPPDSSRRQSGANRNRPDERQLSLHTQVQLQVRLLLPHCKNILRFAPGGGKEGTRTAEGSG